VPYCRLGKRPAYDENLVALFQPILEQGDVGLAQPMSCRRCLQERTWQQRGSDGRPQSR
jgi:hypothetical protein